ncbi:hypothetical protein EYF80_056708 [Liparis tanakae]|uniref:Uncharacterized protein n=1 Tax=Liparis tanakae TaxID=230148 RepID=A0A4Z2EW53_9TELE|nr:hypothetical protein EYF80_056708 [Liparis tanakae]
MASRSCYLEIERRRFLLLTEVCQVDFTMSQSNESHSPREPRAGRNYGALVLRDSTKTTKAEARRGILWEDAAGGGCVVLYMFSTNGGSLCVCVCLSK